jgi:hypothetical protein
MGTFLGLYIPSDLTAPQPMAMIMNAVGRDKPEYHCDFSFSFPPSNSCMQSLQSSL